MKTMHVDEVSFVKEDEKNKLSEVVLTITGTRENRKFSLFFLQFTENRLYER